MEKNFILNLKSKLVPLAFGVLITVSFMYTYDSALTLLFLLCSVVIQGLIYVFYDYISTKNKIMQYISILGSLFAMLFLIIIIGSLYNQSNMVDFMVWFLSPQSVVSYSLQYIFVMLVGLNFFISSTIYYFTQVRYRMITTFFLLLMPFAIFTREDETVPIMFLLPLIVLYFSTLIVCGQNNLYKNERLITIENKSYVKSIGTFVLSFLLIISAIPKPQITADRETFENLIQANNFTDYLLSQLGNFTDTSNGTGYSYSSSTRVLFSAKTSETVSLKARTFSNYNFNQNVWLRADGVKSLVENANIDTTLHFNNNETSLVNYDRYGTKLSNNTTNDFQQSLNPSKLLNAIVFACKENPDFAQKYNLSNIPTNENFSNCIKEVEIECKSFPTSFILNPTNSFKITSSEKLISTELLSTYSGVITGINEQSYFGGNAKYSLEYYSDELLRNSTVIEILSQLNFDMYGDFLKDLQSVTKNSQFEDVITSYIQDYDNTVIYCTIFPDCKNEKIKSLAEDVTKECNSDIEKAIALENYFISNGYIYDADYQQEKGSTIEAFLFENKTGACYDYSTSMILMARSLGLPARYVEGFLVNNSKGDGETINITASSSHAYPEVYISGYGWCYFEPTQTLFIEEEDNNTLVLSENYKLFLVSLILVIITILVSIFMMFVYPRVYEKHFRKKILNQPLDIALNSIVNRIRKVAKISNSQTLEEIKISIMENYSLDISNLIEISNIIFYGNSKSYDKSKQMELLQKCLSTYITLYDTIIQTNKEHKKLKHKAKKS